MDVEEAEVHINTQRSFYVDDGIYANPYYYFFTLFYLKNSIHIFKFLSNLPTLIILQVFF